MKFRRTFLWIAARWKNTLAVLLVCLVGFAGRAAGQQPIIVTDQLQEFPVGGNHLAVLEDRGAKLTVRDVASPPVAARFQSVPQAVPNFGVTTSAYWVRLLIVDSTSALRTLLIEAAYSRLGRIELWYENAPGNFSLKIGGDSFPFSQREIADENIVFRFPFRVHDTTVVYVRLLTSSTMIIPLKLWTGVAFVNAEHKQQLLSGLFYGMLLIMLVYNLFLSFSIRDRSYLYYVGYVLVYGLYFFSLDGLAVEYLWPACPWWDIHAVTVFVGGFLLLGAFFSCSFLSTGNNAPFFHRLLLGVGVCGAFLIPASFVLPIASANKISMFLGLAYILVQISAGAACLRNGNPQSFFFLIAVGGFLFGMAVQVFRFLNFIPLTFLTLSIMKIGALWEITLLSLGLGNRINTVRREKDHEKLQLRDRISADLHDEIGSNLGAIAVLSQVMQTEPATGGRLRQTLDEIGVIATSTADEMREIVWFINPEHATVDTLVRKMEATASNMLCGISFVFRGPEKTGYRLLDMVFCRNLFLIYKEILHNVLRHSCASFIEISVGESRGVMKMLVKDNGIGFDPGTCHDGCGLKNIRKRVADIGGKIIVESRTGEGTFIAVTAKIP